jgi:alpha-mannosidase
MTLQETKAPDAAPSPVGVEQILLLHHSHFDVGYTHSQPVVWELQREFIDQALDWLEQTSALPDGTRPKWTCEASEPLRRWLETASSSQRDRFRRLLHDGRIGVGALRWHASAGSNRDGLRRLLDGKAELELELGTQLRVACQHDVTGVPWPLADVLLDADVDLFVMATNTHLGRAVQPRPGMFMWEAPSGRRLRVLNGHHYTMFDQLLFSWEDSVERMNEGWQALRLHLDTAGYSLPFLYLTSACAPVMWDNAPPNPFLPDLVARWNASGFGPRVQYVTFEDVRTHALAVPERALPVLRGDWTDYWSFGYGSAPIATGLSRRAQSLIAASAFLGDGAREVLGRAIDRLDLYDEHTFGYWDSANEHPQAQTTELLKQALAYEGYELASFVAMDRLERLGENPVADKGIKGVLVCNPSAEAVRIRPRVPAGWCAMSEPETERTYRASRMTYDGRSWEDCYPGEAHRCLAPVELEPMSWRIVPLTEDACEAAGDEARPTHTVESIAVERRETNLALIARHSRRRGTIETSHYRFEYEPDSGRIVSLADKRRELLNLAAGLDFFAYVRERADALDEGSRNAFYQRDLDNEKFDISCWKAWSPIREPATRITRCDVREHSGRVTFERAIDAPGVIRLIQRITFSADDPLIQLEAELELEPEASPQSVYFAFPLAAAGGWEAIYDTAGQPVRLDEDQLPGACRNWVTVDTFAAIGNSGGAAALFCIDAPLVQFGDFHFGPPVDAVPRPENPLLLAWPINNYWDTNFPRVQRGRIRLRYGFMSFDSLDADALLARGHAVRRPALVWPVTTNGRTGSSGPLRAA